MPTRVQDGLRYKLVQNKYLCKMCDSTIESKSRHDFVTCKCGNLSIDGGITDSCSLQFLKPE